MKRKILLLAAFAICASVAASGTIAFFTASETAHNIITTGSAKIAIIEKTLDDAGNEIDFPQTGISGLMPGESADKIVTVENTGESDVWVRVLVNIAISEPGDPITNPLIKNLPLEIDVNGVPTPVVTLDIDDTNWIYEDGYYYYTSALMPGVITPPLFTKVSFAKETGDAYQGCKILVDVTVEAVQTANNGIPAGSDVTDVPVWTNP